MSKRTPCILALLLVVLSSVSAETDDLAERMVNQLLLGVPATDEDLAAIAAAGDPAGVIVAAVAVEHRLAKELSRREEALAELGPITILEATKQRRFDVAAGIALGAGVVSFVVQDVLARLSDTSLFAYDDSNDPADLEQARVYAAGSLIAAGVGVVSFGSAIPLLSVGGRPRSPIGQAPKPLADLWWAADPQAQAAQLRLDRDRALRQLELSRRTQRAYKIGTLGAGSVTIASGIIGGIAVARGGEFYRLYQAAQFSSEAQDLRGRIEAQQTIALTAGSVGGAGLATLVALLLVRPRPEGIQAEIDEMERRINRLERVD